MNNNRPQRKPEVPTFHMVEHQCPKRVDWLSVIAAIVVLVYIGYIVVALLLRLAGGAS